MNRDHRLATWVREDFGIELATTDPVSYGADEAAELWRATTADGSAWAVKLSGGGTPAGLLVSSHLARRGVPGVAAPLTTRDGRVCGVREGRRLSVVPWVSDDRALGGGMDIAHWRAYGEVLAAAHAIEVTGPLAELLPREDHTHATIGSAVRAMDRTLHAVEDASVDPLTAEVAGEWRAVADVVAALLEQADALGAELRERPATFVVCHGDPHLGNLLLGAGGRVWVIDWDDAVLAPRERDLMFVLGGVLAFAPITGWEQAAFFEGYGSVDPDRDRLAYHLCVRAMDDISSWAGQVADTGREEAERAEALAIVRGLLSPVGLITLARSALRDLGRLPTEDVGAIG